MTRQIIKQGQPAFSAEMETAAVDALRNDDYLRGENVNKFEEEFAKFIGTDYAISTNSGTDALIFIWKAFGAKGNRIVTSPFSFIASANSILMADAYPVFSDISLDNYCMTAEAAKSQLDRGAKGMLPVHIFGQPVDYDSFEDLGKKYNVPIVEDSCQGHGAFYKGKRVGSLGIAAAFSFYPSKNMTVLGDGGMVTTNDKQIADYVSRVRDGGRVSWYEHDIVGYTSRMTSVSAAIGRVQLRHLDEWNERRRHIVAIYRKYLEGLHSIVMPIVPAETLPVYHQFVIRANRRNELKGYLEKNGIQTGIHYPIPIHLQPLYEKLFGFQKESYPKSEKIAEECLSLPMHPFISDDDAGYVCESIRTFYGRQ